MRRTASTGLQIPFAGPQDPQQLPQLKQLTVEAVAQQLSPPFQASPGCQCEDGCLVLPSDTHWHYWRWLWLPDAEECLPDQFCWNHIAIMIVHEVAYFWLCAITFQAMNEQSNFKQWLNSHISSHEWPPTFQLTVEAVAQQLSPPFQASPGCQCEDGCVELPSDTHWHYWRWLWLPDAEECLPDQYCWNHIAIVIVRKVAHLAVCRHILSHEWAQSNFKQWLNSHISSHEWPATFQTRARHIREFLHPWLPNFQYRL